MNNHITCLYELEVKEGKLEGFRELIKRVVAATRQEPGVLLYEYSISDDGAKAYIVERYRPEALVPHVDIIFAPFAESFLEHVKFTRLLVFGDVTSDLHRRLDPFGAIYVKPYAGFDRFEG